MARFCCAAMSRVGSAWWQIYQFSRPKRRLVSASQSPRLATRCLAPSSFENGGRGWVLRRRTGAPFAGIVPIGRASWGASLGSAAGQDVRAPRYRAKKRGAPREPAGWLRRSAPRSLRYGSRYSALNHPTFKVVNYAAPLRERFSRSPVSHL